MHVLLESLSGMQRLPWTLMLDQFEGSEPYSRQLNAQLDRYGMRERVRFIHAAHGEVSDYMNAADVVVLPSLSTRKWKEQYGRVAPEAMACGRLVVAARSGTLPELVGEHGILFSEGDRSALTECLQAIVHQPELLQRTEEIASYACERLSVEAQAEQMLRVFERLVSR